MKLSKGELSYKGSRSLPIEGRSLVDVGGLDRRGISGVDVGHDDRTIIKRFAFLFSIYLYFKPLYFRITFAVHPSEYISN